MSKVQTKGIIEVKCNKCGAKFTMPTLDFYARRPTKTVKSETVEVNGRTHEFPLHVEKVKLRHNMIDKYISCSGTLSTVQQRKPKTNKPSRDRKPRAHAKG